MLWTDALETEPGLAEDLLDVFPDQGKDLPVPPRFHAARSAALAVAGRGIDDPPPDASSMPKLRATALRWLRIVREVHAKALAADNVKTVGTAAWQLELIKSHADFAPVRDPAALAKLPEAERNEWQNFWASVDRLLSGETE